MNLLRLMTPGEISELTTTSASTERNDLTNIVQFELAGNDYRTLENESDPDETDDKVEHKAKILSLDPKNNEDEKEKKADVFLAGEKSMTILKAFNQECMEREKNLLGQKRRTKKRTGRNQKQMSTFIIEEKKKLDESYGKLKTVEVLDLYQKNASVDLELQKNNKDDLSKSSQSGILVNKKQA